MNLDRWHRQSLKRTLLVVLVPGLLVVGGAELWLARRTAVEAANAAYDRSLLGAVKSIDASISTDSGGLAVELPYRMLEFFELTASGPVHYRVSTEDGLVEIGTTELPRPSAALVTGQPQFVDTTVFGEPVRLASYARVLERAIGGATVPQRVVVQVAEPLTSREQFTRRLVAQALSRDLVLVLVAGSMLLLVITWALRPLGRLRDEVSLRTAQDLTPIHARDVPADVWPLIAALNQHLDRTRAMIEARRRFIDDASHQLRTPLATLATQLGYALRVEDSSLLREALAALKTQLDETVRQTNQMLALARADSAELNFEPLDAVRFAGEVTRGWWAEARERGIDLGLDASSGTSLCVNGHAALLKEALGNLLHNAIRYTPRDGHVTVRISAHDGRVRLAVVDDGPGIPDDERHRAGERFFRGRNAGAPGSGIGLAIVRSIAERHGGSLEIRRGEGAHGLEAAIVLPLLEALDSPPG
jgi:two-component system sensor histidine kinase TctE